MNCEHPQCCICLKRECQQSQYVPRFKKYGGLLICGDSCLSTAVSVAYSAACKLGGCQEQPCGKNDTRRAKAHAPVWVLLTD